MTKNPLINALTAVLYIVFIVLLMTFITQTSVPQDEKGIIIPIAMLSLFVLSAAMMGYLFCLTPLQLYLDGHKKEGVNLFVGTLRIFAIITAFIFGVLFFLVRV